MKPTTYEITVRGRMGATLAAAFDGLAVSASEADTVLRGELPDQAALFAALACVESLGLELLGVHRVAA